MSDLTGRNEQYDYLRRLDVSELEQLLQLAVDPYEDEEDSAYVEALLEVIEEKEKAAGRLPDAKEKWSEFQQYYNTEERQGQFLYYEETDGASLAREGGKKARVSNLRRYKRVLLAAALVALLAALIPIPAFGHRTVVQQLVACWTGEQFTFRSVDSAAESEIREEFVEVRDALEKRGVTEMTFPTYIPEEFEIEKTVTYVSPQTGDVGFALKYVAGKQYIFFDIIQNNARFDIIREKDDSSVEIYTVNSRDHYIYYNRESRVITWQVEEVEWSIDSSLSIVELKKIIDSMYGRDTIEKE